MFHNNVERYLGDLFGEYPQYRKPFLASGFDIELPRLDMRDEFKTFVIRQKFPSLDVSADIWKEVLRFNGHFLSLTLTWVEKMVRYCGIVGFNHTIELMFQHKVEHTQNSQQLYKRENT